MAAIMKQVRHHAVDIPIRFLWTEEGPWYQAKGIALFLGIQNIPRALSMCPSGSVKTLNELSALYGGPARYGRIIPEQTMFLNDDGLLSFTRYRQRAPIIMSHVPWLLGELVTMAHKPILPGDPDIITEDRPYSTRRLPLPKRELESRTYEMGDSINELKADLAALRAELGKTKDALRTLAQLVAPILEKHN